MQTALKWTDDDLLLDFQRTLEGKSPEDTLCWAAAQFPGKLTFATGFGVEGCVLIDLIARLELPIDLFTLDTGLLFPETYELWRKLESRYGVKIRGVQPEQSVEEQAAAHGDKLWQTNPDRCCELRKVIPLRNALRGFDAWITAVRRDQTKARASAQPVEKDPKFGLFKVNPLVGFTSKNVWDYVFKHKVPYNPLHDQGFPSIGCFPCTSAVKPGEDPRAGRWRGREKTECGLHGGAASPSPSSSSEVQPNPQIGAVTNMSQSVAPHGGTLVNALVSGSEAETLKQKAATLPKITLDARELADLELIAIGAVSPIRGFLGQKDYASVLERMRLSDGTVWPLPLTLAVAEDVRPQLEVGKDAALYDAGGRLWGTIRISELYERDPLNEARWAYATEDKAHPGVAYLLSRPTHLAAGEVKVLPLPEDLPFAKYRFTPAQLREKIAALGWRKVAGFQTRNPIHRAHEHLTKLALEFSDGLIIHPLVGETKNDDVPAAVRFQVYETLVANYYPQHRTLLAAFPAAMRYAGPREALFHALVRKNYGINQLVVGRDHAGVGKFYGPLEAQQIFDRFTPDELGISPLKFEPTFFCKACDNLASVRTCPHDANTRVDLSGTKVRETLRAGGDLPKEFSRPEIAEILRKHYVSVNPPAAPAAQANGAPLSIGASAAALKAEADQLETSRAKGQKGFILWFTGLSGAGKSTLAQAIRLKLASDRTVEVLDGDEVRTYLSKGLGFSKEDRDTNIRRIGFVARVLARNGVAAITAAISPYAELRDEVKTLAAKEGVPFVEVFTHAELDKLVERDVKGLYKKAIAGEIQHFTGVNDPYEAPENPDVVVRSDRESVEESATKILSVLVQRGLLPAPRTA
jgi:sulfate adenylyltransferase